MPSKTSSRAVYPQLTLMPPVFCGSVSRHTSAKAVQKGPPQIIGTQQVDYAGIPIQIFAFPQLLINVRSLPAGNTITRCDLPVDKKDDTLPRKPE